MTMRSFRFLLVCGILFVLLLVGVGQAAAQDSAPTKTLQIQLGPYPVSVNYYNEPRGGEALIFSITPETEPPGPITYKVTALPGTTVNAVPVKATLEADPGRSGAVRGQVNLPVSGQWMLFIEADGPLGSAAEDVPILASARPAVPEWFGWMIGLIPVWAVIGFILAQARRTPRRLGHQPG
jgi:hypothetical protein